MRNHDVIRGEQEQLVANLAAKVEVSAADLQPLNQIGKCLLFEQAWAACTAEARAALLADDHVIVRNTAMYAEQDELVVALIAKGDITAADLHPLNRVGKFRLIDRAWSNCSVEAKKILRADAHHSVRSCAVVADMGLSG